MRNFLKHFGPSGKHGGKLPVYTVDLDQCMFGLRSPAGVSPAEIWKKGTTILSNNPGVKQIVRTGNHTHLHTPIFGAVKVRGKSVLRSSFVVWPITETRPDNVPYVSE